MNDSGSVDILLVEDNPADAELAMHALRSGNITDNISWVQDGAEALDFILCKGAYAGRSEQNPRVILLDLKLPKVGGIEVLKQIRQTERTRSIPVVVLTSSSQGRDVSEAYQFGVNSYVVKPVEFGQYSKFLQSTGFYWTQVNTAQQPA